MRTIEKIGAIIIKNKKMLVIRKSESNEFTPIIGRIEENETFYGALRREIKENLGVRAKKTNQFETIQIPKEEIMLAISCYLIELEDNEIKLKTEIQQMDWINSKSKKKLSQLSQNIIPKLKKQKLIG